MIIGVGIDAVEIARFAQWHTKPYHRLNRIFTESEIAYCLQNPAKSAERFAARYAAREALYKIMHTQFQIPFLTLCRAITIIKDIHGKPAIMLDRHILSAWNATRVFSTTWHLTMTHTHTTAIAFIIAEIS